MAITILICTKLQFIKRRSTNLHFVLLPSGQRSLQKSTKNNYALFPAEIQDHPAPYYKSPPVDFGKITEKPWETAPKPQASDAAKGHVANAVVDDVINEVVQDELMSTSVEVMEERVIKVSYKNNARQICSRYLDFFYFFEPRCRPGPWMGYWWISAVYLLISASMNLKFGFWSSERRITNVMLEPMTSCQSGVNQYNS
jgi:hypothetical protein